MLNESHTQPTTPKEAVERAGRYQLLPAGHRAFVPVPLPPVPPVRIAGELQTMLSRADLALGRLDGSIQTLPNPDLFVFMLTCYREKRECLAINIESAGVVVFPIHPPFSFDVRLWTADRIVADFAAPCGDQPNPRSKQEWQTTVSETWIIDRTRQTAELIDHPCLGAKTYHWTIEDPPFWKKAKERPGDP